MSELQARMDDLGWTPKEPREVYDRQLFQVIEQLVRDVERLKVELAEAKATA